MNFLRAITCVTQQKLGVITLIHHVLTQGNLAKCWNACSRDPRGSTKFLYIIFANKFFKENII